MPAIGDVWTTATWDDDAWAANTWAAAVSGVDFTAQETLTLAAIYRYAATPEVIIRTVTPALNRRTTEVE